MKVIYERELGRLIRRPATTDDIVAGKIVMDEPDTDDADVNGVKSEYPEGHEMCDRCHSVGPDRRTLYMSCFYDMTELGLPFKKVSLYTGYEKQEYEESPKSLTDPIHNHGFTLRVCKACRATWMASITNWFRSQTNQEESKYR